MSEYSMQLNMNRVGYRIGNHTLIDDISLNSSINHCTALLGANGAGKSTFLRLCHGLLTPTSGEIYWGTQAPQALGRRITMVFQKPCLLKRSVYANLSYALYLHRVRSSEREKRIKAAFQLVHLTHQIHRSAQLLSGGEQKKLAIARAWVLQPDIILFDEPTAGLDIDSTHAVEKIISDLSQQGIKIIIASHNLAQVRRLCDEIIFLDQGRVIQQCGTQEFFDNPREKTICEFIKSQVFS